MVSAIFFEQNSNGSWELSEQLARECGQDLEELRQVADGLEGPDAERILATQLVLLLAERLEAEQQLMMRPMLRKARRWLDTALRGLSGGGAELRDRASKLLP
jgi:hypothetical protein